MKQLGLFILVFFSVALNAQSLKVSSGFTGIKVYDGILLAIDRSDSTALEITDGNRKEKDFQISVDKGILTIRLQPEARKDAQVRMKLMCKHMKSIEGYGKSEITTNSLIKGDSLSVELRSGAIGFIDMDVKYLDALILEGSLMTSEGYAVKQQIVSKTGATFSGFKLQGETGKVHTGSGGKAKVYITKEVVAKAGFKGYIGYKSNPKFITRKTFLFGEIIDQNEE